MQLINDNSNDRIAIVTVHGQGTYKKNAHKELSNNVINRLDIDPSKVKVLPVYYYSKIQKAQDELLERMGDISPRMLVGIREKIVSSFGDPSTIYFDKDNYNLVMEAIKEQFVMAQKWIGFDGQIIVLAHSLGTAVISNFLWDAQQAGIKYNKLKLLVTTGSPLPVFISGIDEDKITPIKMPSYNFKWLNLWKKKDVLSFPLSPVNEAYDKLVEDIRVKKGFYLFAHGSYASDKKVIKKIAKEINKLL